MKPLSKTVKRDAAAIEGWLVNELSQLLERPASEIRTDRSIFEFGIDSSAAIGLTDLLSEFLDHEVDPHLFYEYETIDGIAKVLASLEQDK
jgi:acyl carrier protein